MDAIMQNGQMVLLISDEDRYQHENNPLHYLCRLVKEGIPLERAKELTKRYEETYNPRIVQ